MISEWDSGWQRVAARCYVNDASVPISIQLDISEILHSLNNITY